MQFSAEVYGRLIDSSIEITLKIYFVSDCLRNDQLKVNHLRY